MYCLLFLMLLLLLLLLLLLSLLLLALLLLLYQRKQNQEVHVVLTIIFMETCSPAKRIHQEITKKRNYTTTWLLNKPII